MKFEIFKNESSGKFYFRLKARNGQVVLSSQAYASKATCKNGIESVRKNAVKEGQFEQKEANDGKPFFNLLASNKQIIGTSQRYSSPTALATGIQSVMNIARDARLVDLTLSE